MTGLRSKYALIERERKYIIAVDNNLIKGLPYKTITDIYCYNTGLRLRKVVDGSSIIYKLTKKGHANGIGESMITTIYLSELEYNVLSALNGVLITKTRFIKIEGDLVIGIDRYKNDSDELWMAEVEFDNIEEMKKFKMSLNYINEVTGNSDFNGYNLAKRFTNNKQ